MLIQKEPDADAIILNSLMLQFMSDYSCFFVPMDISIHGEQKNKKPLKGYGWANLNEDQYQTDRARLLNHNNDKASLQELNKLEWRYQAAKRTKQLNDVFDLLEVAKKQSNQYYQDKLKGWNNYLQKVKSMAVIAGASDLIVFDCDTEGHNTGNTSEQCESLNTLKSWCTSSGIDFNIFLNTLTVRTPSGGYHFIFRYIDKFRCGNDSIKKQISFLKSIDLIAGHNVFIAPYSAKIYDNQKALHYLPVKLSNQDDAFNFEYLPATASTRLQIKVLPDELERAITKKQEKPLQQSRVIAPRKFYASTERQRQKASKILSRNLQEFSLAGNGTRHDALLKYVRNVFMFYNYLTDYPKDYILDMFRDRAIQLGLSISEIETPLKDAMNYGLNNQKHLD